MTPNELEVIQKLVNSNPLLTLGWTMDQPNMVVEIDGFQHVIKAESYVFDSFELLEEYIGKLPAQTLFPHTLTTKDPRILKVSLTPSHPIACSFGLLKVNELKLRAALKKRPVELLFTKKDGSMRNMITTPNIPEEHLPKGTGTVKQTDNGLINVFEANIQAWRSVRIDSIIDWN